MKGSLGAQREARENTPPGRVQLGPGAGVLVEQFPDASREVRGNKRFLKEPGPLPLDARPIDTVTRVSVGAISGRPKADPSASPG